MYETFEIETTIEGTLEEILQRVKTIPGQRRVRLQLLPDEDNLYDASPEEREKALDAIAEMNKHLPPLPEDALSRENLYDEQW